jgi:DNA-binding PadR family transcriptional regulator
LSLALDERARVLEVVAGASCGVRDVIQRLKWKASRVVTLLTQMEDEGLVELRSKPAGRGRPKKAVVPTSLGLEFLEAYRRLETKPLRARRADLERAKRDALYVERLVAAGHSVFELFMELNTIVRSAGESEEAS